MTKQSKISAAPSATGWRDSLPPIPLTPVENKEQFETLLQAVTADLDPHGPYEHILAQNIFELEWEKWRLRRWRESLLRSKSQYVLENIFLSGNEYTRRNIKEKLKNHPRRERITANLGRKFENIDANANEMAYNWINENEVKVKYVRSVMEIMGISEGETISTAYLEILANA